MATTKLPNGILVRDNSNNVIYFIDNGTKRHITSMEVLGGGAFVDIDSSHLTDIPDGKPISTKPSFNWKSQAEINKLLTSTGVNWQKPRGYAPKQPTPTPAPTPVPTPTPAPTPVPAPTPKTPMQQPTESETIGKNAVNHLYQLYLGRDANQQEIDMYMSHLDDSVLRKDLEMSRKKAQEDAKAQTDISGKTNDFFFQGNEALVKFNDDPNGAAPGDASTIWLVDKNSQSMRPFLDETGFIAKYGMSPQEAMDSGLITTLPTTALTNQDSTLFNFQLLGNEQGINEAGTYTPDNVSEEDIGRLYGQEYNAQAQQASFKVVDHWLGLIKEMTDSGIDPDVVQEALNDPNTIGLYVNALAYGGYGPNDIYRDLKRKQLVKGGDSEYANMQVIHSTQTANEYHATAEGQAIRSNMELAPPPQLGDIDTSLLDLSIFQLPSEVFQTLVQPFDWTSPEAQEEAEKIKSAYHDVLTKQLEAQTDQQKAIADHEWETFRQEMNRLYGIQLSDNAYSAWDQINSITSGYGQANLGDSGLLQEAKDRYLQDVRRGDETVRESKASQETEARRKHLLANATPEEIAALTAEERVAWGLTPSQDVLSFFDVQNLVSKYGLSEQEAIAYRDLMIDENGNYRSTLYQNLYANKYGISESKKTYQLDQLLEQKKNEEEKRYAEYTQAGAFDSAPTTQQQTGTDPSDSSAWSINPENTALGQAAAATAQANQQTGTDPSDSSAWSINPANQQSSGVADTGLGQAAEAAAATSSAMNQQSSTPTPSTQISGGGIWKKGGLTIDINDNYQTPYGYFTPEDLTAQGFTKS